MGDTREPAVAGTERRRRVREPFATAFFTVEISATADDVWAVLTGTAGRPGVPPGLSATSQRPPGSAIRSTTDGAGADAAGGHVLAAAPPRRLVHTIAVSGGGDDDDEVTSYVTWELRSRGPSRVMVTLTVDDFDPDLDEVDVLRFWPLSLEKLEALAEAAPDPALPV